MKLNPEPAPILAICLNPAWQQTLIFSHLTHGEVNRARELHECGGGKGVNVIRVYQQMGLPSAIAAFVGGDTGRKLEEELSRNASQLLLVHTQAATRCCHTVISEDNAEVTELIEPSGKVTETEVEEMRNKILSVIPASGAVVFSGTVAPGVPAELCAEIAAACQKAKVPFILDAVKNILPALEAGVRLLKINAAELQQISGLEGFAPAACKLLKEYPRLEILAVTDGPNPARLFTRNGSWCLHVPRLAKIVSAIGGGDTTTAVFARRIAEGAKGDELPQAFAEALACASASCLTDTPSVFSQAEAANICAQIQIESC